MKKLIHKQKSISIILIMSLIAVGFICGIATGLSRKNRENVNNIINEKMIYKNTISPNENFVENENDKVFYTIEVYQNDNDIKVVANSNSSFTKEISYEIESDTQITENDVNVEWETIMGDTNFAKENQIAVAVISISSNGEVISQRKVNFISKAVDIIVDTINKN